MGVLLKFFLFVVSAIVSIVATAFVISHFGINTPFDHYVDQILHNEPDVRGLITSQGYPFEEHTVETEDGFILTQHRVRHGRAGQGGAGPRKVVLLVHGLMGSSDNFFINLPEQSLGFVMADAGFDVWVANLRGTRYGSRHMKYHYTDKEFSDFSFDEMARYDLPAIIDKVLSVTGAQQIYYVGMSQGAMASYALLSEQPEYNKKIKMNIGLCPVAYVGNMTDFHRYFFLYQKYFVDLFGSSHHGEHHLPTRITRAFCKHVPYPCVTMTAGLNPDRINKTRIGLYLTYIPGGTSARAIAHLGQNIILKTFSKYDFGAEKNMVKYGQTTPPEYDMTKVTAPTALFWSAGDHLATPDDIAMQASKLPNLVLSHKVADDTFTHVDFGLSLSAADLVYKEVVTTIEEFERTPKVKSAGGSADKVKKDVKASKETANKVKKNVESAREKAAKVETEVKTPKQNVDKSKSDVKSSKTNVGKDKTSSKN